MSGASRASRTVSACTSRVVDTGIGIAADKQAAIFQAFTQADGSTTRRYGGTGLGLTICAQLVALMGGRIWVESTPDTGSAFQFTLTLPESREPVAPQCSAGVEELAGLAALVVDDNPTNLRIVSEILSQRGMRVVEAQRRAPAAVQAVDATDSARSRSRSIDMEMPGANGVDLAAALRRHPRCASAPVIILTSADRPQEARSAAAIPDVRWIVKPVGQTALLETIRAALSARSSRDAQPAAPVGDADAGGAAAARAGGRGQRRQPEAGRAPAAAPRPHADHGDQRTRGHRGAAARGRRSGADGPADAGDGRLRGDGRHPRSASAPTGERMPIVALTAHAMEGDRQRCLDADMDGYVSKPVKAVELFEVIDRVMAAAQKSAA